MLHFVPIHTKGRFPVLQHKSQKKLIYFRKSDQSKSNEAYS